MTLRHHLCMILALAAAGVGVAACGQSSGTVTGVGTSESPNASSSPIGMSRCMRAHGLTNFPDPTNGPGGEGFNGVGITNTGTLIVDGTSFSGPVATAAEKACRRFLPPGGPPRQLSASQREKVLRFAECMRAHGVPNLPDPRFGSGAQVPNPASPPINPNSPAFKHAQARCGNGTVRITAVG